MSSRNRFFTTFANLSRRPIFLQCRSLGLLRENQAGLIKGSSVLIRPNSLKPNLTPVRIHFLGAEKAARAVSRLTNYRFQYYARIFHVHHFLRLFANDFRHAVADFEGLSTVGYQLRIPAHSPILIRRIDGLKDLFVRLNANQLARLEVQGLSGSWLAFGNDARIPRKERTAKDRNDPVVKPAHRAPDTDACFTDAVVCIEYQTADNAAEADITGEVIFQILARVPPRKGSGCERDLSHLANIFWSFTVRRGSLHSIADVVFSAFCKWLIVAAPVGERRNLREFRILRVADRFQPGLFPVDQAGSLAAVVGFTVATRFEMDCPRKPTGMKRVGRAVVACFMSNF